MKTGYFYGDSCKKAEKAQGHQGLLSCGLRGFWRLFTTLVRKLWPGIFCGLLPLLAQGQADFYFGGNHYKLGSADRYGYARWYVDISSVRLNTFTVSVRVYFSTDPRLPDGILGHGWSLPLMESRLVEEKRERLVWHRPDNWLWLLDLERNSISAKTGEVYRSVDDRWQAVRQKGTRKFTITDKKSGTFLEYENGLLTRFSLSNNESGTNTERAVYTISYTSSRRPLRLMEMSKGTVLVEIVYDGRDADHIVIGDKTVGLGWTDATLNRFGQNPRLSSIHQGSPREIAVSYGTSESGSRNRAEFFQTLPLPGKTFVEWNPDNGFLLEDAGARYEIKNPDLADNGRRPALETNPASAQKEPGKSAGKESKDSRKPASMAARSPGYNWRPKDAEITRIDQDGKREYRFFDRDKGVSTRITPDGVKTVTRYLLTPGPMMMKIRKQEEIRDGVTTVLVRNSYDELGRCVRQIDKNGVLSLWEYLENGNFVRNIVDGQLASETHYQAGRLVNQKTFPDGGRVRTCLKLNQME
jgi:hypothetical protein